MDPLLSVRDLRIAYRGEESEMLAVAGVDFTLWPRERLGLVGESGCGKSTIALALMGLLPAGTARIVSGEIVFDGRDVLRMNERSLRAIRGKDMAMVFQDAMTSLHPLLSIGRQISETLEVHLGMTARQARARALDLLRMVGVAAPERQLKAYPHELSGGMCQRAMIAIALACGPKLLLADEPTTALDVTVQAQIFELIARICVETDTAMLLITHDLGVVAGMTDRVAVIYAGTVVETAATTELFARPTHPYTRGLLASVPRVDARLGEALPTIPGSIDLSGEQRGCRFAPRCTYAEPRCHDFAPPLIAWRRSGHHRACWVEPTRIEGGEWRVAAESGHS
jgi:oligopeptide/dipeptide ABC transporter ATP-binding protein